MWQGLALSLVLLPQVMLADVLTYAIWPDSNPTHSLACRIELFTAKLSRSK